MMTSPDAYRRSAILTASRGQLVVILYDAAHRFLAQAATAMRAGDIRTAHARLRRGETIIRHLRATLDFEQGGEIAVNLSRIYGFCMRHLNEARMHVDAERIERVDGLLLQLREAWAQIATE